MKSKRCLKGLRLRVLLDSGAARDGEEVRRPGGVAPAAGHARRGSEVLQQPHHRAPRP